MPKAAEADSTTADCFRAEARFIMFLLTDRNVLTTPLCEQNNKERKHSSSRIVCVVLFGHPSGFFKIRFLELRGA